MLFGPTPLELWLKEDCWIGVLTTYWPYFSNSVFPKASVMILLALPELPA